MKHWGNPERCETRIIWPFSFRYRYSELGYSTKFLPKGGIYYKTVTEVDALERRVQKKTGVTDLAVLGTPSAGGNLGRYKAISDNDLPKQIQ